MMSDKDEESGEQSAKPDTEDTVDLPLLTEASNSDQPVMQDAELESFRQKWRAELKVVSKQSSPDHKHRLATSRAGATKNSAPARSLVKNINQNELLKCSNESNFKLSTVPENPTVGSASETSIEPTDDNGNKTTSAPVLSWKNSNRAALVMTKNVQSNMSEEEKEALAQGWYVKGVELERSGKLYEAIQQYKKAMMLVPDIESRTASQFTSGSGTEEISDDEGEQGYTETHSTAARGITALYSKLVALLDPMAPVCRPQYVSGAAHISCLPREIMEQILLWVVGSELDMRSLDAMAAVCRGFYVLTKSDSLWKKACQRVYGSDCSLQHRRLLDQETESVKYNTWREMFLSRPQPRYNGCYISKTSYFRSGESNFLDSTYQPWYIVSYYRFLRFFPGGTVLMLTTTDAPQTIVVQLSNRDPKHTQVLVGSYTLEDSLLHLQFNRCSDKKSSASSGGWRALRGRRREHGTTDVESSCLFITVELMTSRRGLRNWFLCWRDYTIQSKLYSGQTKVTTVDVSRVDSYPQLAFSRVKSYTKESIEPLA